MQTMRPPADAALLLADGAGARPIVGVGLRATVEEFLDGGRDGLGSGYLTRLKVGPGSSTPPPCRCSTPASSGRGTPISSCSSA